MRLAIRKREAGQRFATYYVAETDDGQVVHRSADEPFGGQSGRTALTLWAAEQGHELTNPATAEPRWAR